MHVGIQDEDGAAMNLFSSCILAECQLWWNNLLV